jgi:2,3-bisphosphoglycerate-independent phosphoglycerate mutase
VTADHGILEVMTKTDCRANVSHTANPVPLALIDPHRRFRAAPHAGKLAHIAPLILDALGVPRPDAMTRDVPPLEQTGGSRRRVLLAILDGWGIGREDGTNPIFLARTPVWDDIIRNHPFSMLQAAGEAVGLKPGSAGNSEAGHLNIGAGRVILQDDVRLDFAMQDGSFVKNDILRSAVGMAGQGGASLHLIGLLSDKSSHGTVGYPLALLRMAQSQGLDRVYLHLIFDGRSTEPGSAPEMLAVLDRRIAEIGAGRIVSGVGRGLALDRDGNYAKTKQAYDAFVWGVGRKYRGEGHCSR